MSSTDVAVRPMRAEEAAAVKAMGERSFSLLARLFFQLSSDVLVAEHEGRLAGAAVLKTGTLPDKRRIGLVAWIYTDPQSRGVGAGQALTDSALRFFDQRDCSHVFACVEGYNSSSTKLWATRGFSVLSPGAQWRMFGFMLPFVLYHASHLFDVGHLLWCRPGTDKPDSGAMQWLGTYAANAALLSVAVARLWPGSAGQRFVPLFVVLLAFLGLRSAGMYLAGRSAGLDLRFRAWESGLPLATAIAVLLHGWYPVVGSWYPRGHDWRYRDLQAGLARMALGGIAAVLVLLAAVVGLGRAVNLGAGARPWLQMGYLVGQPLAILDVLMPFFPLSSYNGRRVWDWNRAAWAVVVILALALIFIG